MESLEDLIREIRNDDENAFRKFFLMFYDDVLRFLYFYTGDKSVAEDLTQDTFVNFWKARDRIDVSQNPKNYLFKVARNLAINYIKRQKEEGKVTAEESNLTQLPDAESFELRDVIIEAISELPDRCREVFILSRYTSLTHKEIAELLGISLQTVKNHITKAINHLRRRLASYLNK